MAPTVPVADGRRADVFATLEPADHSAIVEAHPTLATHPGVAYPVIPTLPADRLRQVWPNTILEQRPQFMRDFLGGGRRPDHPLHALLERYLQARRSLSDVQAKLEQLQRQLQQQAAAVWQLEPVEKAVTGLCGDEAPAQTVLRHNIAVYHMDARQTVASSLAEVRKLVFEQEATYHARAEMACSNVEQFLARVLSRCQERQPPPLDELRHAIDVLFYFARQKAGGEQQDAVFQEHLQRWLNLCLHTLTSMGTLEDHRFLLEHLLRLRHGQTGPLTPFIRFVPCDVWDDELLSHVMAMLYSLMHPAEPFEGEDPRRSAPSTDSPATAAADSASTGAPRSTVGDAPATSAGSRAPSRSVSGRQDPSSRTCIDSPADLTFFFFL